YRSAAWPQKILDAAIAELNPAQPLFLLLTETTLLGYRFENGNLVEDLKLAVPVESEGPASRDPRGMLAFYRFQSADHVLGATHRTGGTYLLRADGGAWSFLRLSSEWLFKSRYAPTPSLVLSAHLVPGKNYFSGDVGLLDFARFAAVLEDRIRTGSEDLSDAL